MRFLYRIKQLILLFGDLIAYSAGFFLSITLRNFSLPGWGQINEQIGLFFSLFLIWSVINYINGLYDLDRHKNTPIFFRRFLETAIFSLIVGFLFFYLAPKNSVAPKTILVLNVVFGYGLCALWRCLYNFSATNRALSTNIIFVGYTPEVFELIKILRNHPEKGYNVVTLIDPLNQIKSAQLPGINVYHNWQAVRPSVTTYHASLVVIAPELRQNSDAERELYELLFWQIQITDLASFYEMITGRISPSTFSEAWFIEHLRRPDQPIYEKMRLVADYAAGIIMGIFCLAIFPLVAAAIKINSRGPIFIKQKRVGYCGKIFTLYKFRSMYALSPDGSAETSGVRYAEKNDVRITFVGNFLRKIRLDELPQFWNLLKREVTLIGPRPERPEIVEKLKSQMPYYPLRHVVRPGLTGWALINQNYTDNDESSLQKLQYDIYYIKNYSWSLDVVIMLRTVNVIVRLMGQ